ncbi:hypothetical protein FRB93_009666 [Tulasnella sp. JGI-2019a]|nr:hypothetical protein FRB93_009666 [Tulasnella sp. JGI-2019a]
MDDEQYFIFSVFDDLTCMKFEPLPATQAAADTIQRFATIACTAQRNCQTLFTLISTARDVCDDINALIHRFDDAELPKDTRWGAFDRYNTMLDTLERCAESLAIVAQVQASHRPASVLEDCDSIPTEESAGFNSNLQSWAKNRGMLRCSIATLRTAAFGNDAGPPDPLLAAFRHDDQSWLDIIYKHISICMSPGTTYSINAPGAFSVLLEIRESFNRSEYEPTVFEVTVRLASNIYTLLDHHDPHEKGTWEMAQTNAESLRDMITLGDTSALGGLMSALVAFDRFIANTPSRVPLVAPTSSHRLIANTPPRVPPVAPTSSQPLHSVKQRRGSHLDSVGSWSPGSEQSYLSSGSSVSSDAQRLGLNWIRKATLIEETKGLGWEATIIVDRTQYSSSGYFQRKQEALTSAARNALIALGVNPETGE